MQSQTEVFSISDLMPSTHGILPFLSFLTVEMISSGDGGSSFTLRIINGVSGIRSWSFILGLFSRFSKWVAHLSSIIKGSVKRASFSSFTRLVLLGLTPIISLVNLETIFESPFFAASSAKAAFCSINCLLSNRALFFYLFVCFSI